MQKHMLLPFFTTLLTICIMSSLAAADGNSFKKNRIKQLSKVSERYNYYEERNNQIVEGSKDPLLVEEEGIGLDARKLKGFGKTQNWVEIRNSKVGSLTKSAGKRIKSVNPFSNKDRDGEPDNNLGIISNSKAGGAVDNTVIIKNSKVENAILGAGVNTGIIIKQGKRPLQRKKYSNDVNIDNSRVGGAAGLLD